MLYFTIIALRFILGVVNRPFSVSFLTTECVCQKYAFQSGQTANYIRHIYNNMPREVKLIPDNGIF